MHSRRIGPAGLMVGVVLLVDWLACLCQGFAEHSWVGARPLRGQVEEMECACSV